MPRTRRTVVAAVAFGLFAALAGCDAGSTAPSSPPPTPSPPAPIFASDEEALAAAEAAYAAYLSVSNQIFRDGGRDRGRIREVSTSDYADVLEAEFRSFEDRGLRMTGSTKYEIVELVGADLATGATQTYACLAVGDSKILDADGNDVTVKDRPAVVAVLLTFERGDVWGELVLGGSEAWSGESFCS
jgi:hypothetical protein